MLKNLYCFIVFIACSIAHDATPENLILEQRLKSLLAGTSPLTSFSVTYSDMHGLHGGLTLTIDGTGKVEQKVVRVETKPTVGLSKEALRDIIKLLVELKAWEQQIPERSPSPDESRAYVRIKVGESSSEIWEWFNDLKVNERIIRISEKMKEHAWPRN